MRWVAVSTCFLVHYVLLILGASQSQSISVRAEQSHCDAGELTDGTLVVQSLFVVLGFWVQWPLAEKSVRLSDSRGCRKPYYWKDQFHIFRHRQKTYCSVDLEPRPDEIFSERMHLMLRIWHLTHCFWSSALKWHFLFLTLHSLQASALREVILLDCWNDYLKSMCLERQFHLFWIT